MLLPLRSFQCGQAVSAQDVFNKATHPSTFVRHIQAVSLSPKEEKCKVDPIETFGRIDINCTTSQKLTRGCAAHVREHGRALLFCTRITPWP
jgi:hypothetical protein